MSPGLLTISFSICNNIEKLGMGQRDEAILCIASYCKLLQSLIPTPVATGQLGAKLAVPIVELVLNREHVVV